MAENTALDNPSKTSNKKESWTGSKSLMAIAGAGMVFPPFVAPKSTKANYAIAGVVGGVGGYMLLNSIFNFDWNYPESDEYATLKGNIEGAIVGTSISIGTVALMMDESLSINQKAIVSAGIGAMLGYVCTDSEFFGKSNNTKDAIGTLIGAGVGVGLYILSNKFKK